MNRLKINNERFSIRFVTIMNKLGIGTVGKAHKFLTGCDAHLKFDGVSAKILLRELKEFMEYEALFPKF